ncbi:PX-associated-domain-containing protein [Diaporthe sp. PMI_573]|nr:PX-associated-domain-containing protein [Diaporthaceae sp. PMI_573]
MASDPPPPTAVSLDPAQLHALFDILTHDETYREAESFKYPYAIKGYGYPFNSDASQSDPPSYNPKSASPLLQLLLTQCILPVPGLGDLPPDFWPTKFQGILSRLADANLSESYDKGAPGTRKTLATLACVIHEAVTRGLLGGVARPSEKVDLQKAQYDGTQAAELERAWNECVRELVHGNLADELFDHCAKDEDFEAHSPAVKAAADYAILHIASLLHHILVLSAEGQYMVKLIENVHKLVPYTMVRQTLRVGNAATMINGMMRIFLAKMSVAAMTNWIGWTKEADDGMNLLQRIINLVLSWDASDFRKQAEKVESSKDKPSKEQLAALREHIALPREAQEEARRKSLAEHKSIVAVILDSADPKLTASMSEAQHTQCLEWYSAQLSVRDRDELSNVFCKSVPDHLTGVMRDAVSAYEPFIRSLHGNLDLRPHVTALESFLNDFIETSKPKQTRPPSVEDYVALLRRNRHLLYKYLHQFAENCTDVREKFRQWANGTIHRFRDANEAEAAKSAGPGSGAAGAMSGSLQDIFSRLPPETRNAVLTALDAHAEYLSKASNTSTERMQRILDALNGSPTKADDMSGPGVYLMRWESSLDGTLITPATPQGPVRTGRDVKGAKVSGKTGAEGVKDGWDAGAIARQEDSTVTQAPDVSVVMEALGESFRDVVREAVGQVGPSTPPDSTT